MKREDRQETQPESPSFFNQHCVLSPMEGLCRTTNSCKAGLIAGACDGLCTTARFRTVAFQNCRPQRQIVHFGCWSPRRFRRCLQCAKNQPLPKSPLPRACVQKNQNNDCSVSRVGSHLADDVLGVSSRATQT